MAVLQEPVEDGAVIRGCEEAPVVCRERDHLRSLCLALRARRDGQLGDQAPSMAETLGHKLVQQHLPLRQDCGPERLTRASFHDRRHMLRHAIVRELGKFRGRAMARSRAHHGAGGDGARACVDQNPSTNTPAHATSHTKFQEPLEVERCSFSRTKTMSCFWRKQRTAAAWCQGKEALRTAGQVLRLHHSWPGDGGRHNGAHDAWNDGTQSTMAAAVQPVVSTVVHTTVLDNTFIPSILSMAGCSHQGGRALVLCPVHVGLRVESEHIACPQLLLPLRSPALLPREVAAHGRHVRVVLGGNRAGFPSVPLANTTPRRCTRVGDQHTLAHDALNDAARQQNRPAHDRHKEKDADIVPGRHVHVHHGILLDGMLISIALLLLQLSLCLRRCNEVGDVLEGRRKPGRTFTGGRLIEEALTGLTSSVGSSGCAVSRLRDHIEANGEGDLHEVHEDRHSARNVDDSVGGMVRVGQSDGYSFDKGTTHLDGEAAAMRRENVHAEHDPNTGSQR
mmetsp:Transcript_82371/g.114356  ORF Transcript_82371/g.114356 Transcript_82371/m.114356 type:complete len:507 (-) Transcript_82371:662-2182(-)